MKNLSFAYAKAKMQISCAISVQLISAFVCALIFISLYIYYIYSTVPLLHPKFQASVTV